MNGQSQETNKHSGINDIGEKLRGFGDKNQKIPLCKIITKYQSYCPLSLAFLSAV